jgi:ATP-dependent Lon protease
VALPDTVLTIALESDAARRAIDAAGDGPVLLVPKLDDRFATVGVIGSIAARGKLPDGTDAVTIHAGRRARLGAATATEQPGLWIETEAIDHEPTAATADLAARYRAVAAELLEHVGGRRLASALAGVTDPSLLADSIGHWPDLSLERRVQLLETVAVDDRLVLATEWASEALAELELRQKVRNDVTEGLEQEQREAMLRRQLASIRKELGDDESGDEFQTRLDELGDALPASVRQAVQKELDRLDRSGDQGTEGSWIRTWLETVFELPWGLHQDDEPAVSEARAVLDADHTGLDEVKDRIVEYLAVRARQQARTGTSQPTSDDSDHGDDETDGQRDQSSAGRARPRRGGTILALVGPPGVGKTSLGESIARTLGRDFVRLSLGGIRDEAEIRGHRRTYVGARPGRVVRALAEAGSMNPVVLLDEIDKVGNDWRGDPSAALLEVLDPAQNHTFRDHYLEFELDLSDVVFLATANTLETIPGPLLDRLEIITIDGYHNAEKLEIARTHLLPRQQSSLGVDIGEVSISDDALEAVVADWTREAGVRGLDRRLERLLRKAVTDIELDRRQAPVTIGTDDLVDLLGHPIDRDDVTARELRPGVAVGLAVTGAGGDVLLVETNVADSKPGLTLTGQLGEVMQESARIALSYLRANAAQLGIESDFDRHFHVHFPAGAVPKDGPSAGIAMTTALAGLLSDRPMRPQMAMTGEISLQGRVLPIGGVKQKVLAAHRGGMTDVILPARNGRDLDELPDEVREAVTIHLVEDIADVLDLALAA